MQTLKQEMTDYYAKLQSNVIKDNQAYNATKLAIETDMEKFVARNPSADACTLKAELYKSITRNFKPVIFPHSPFFYEMGVRISENWGTPNPANPGSWVFVHNTKAREQTQEWKNIRLLTIGEQTPAKFWNIHHGFDYDHHCLGYTYLLEAGINGVLEKLSARRKSGELTQPQQSFLAAAETGCLCMIEIADKFAAQARLMLSQNPDPQAKRFLQMMADTATRVPANPPRNFYEALAMMWFLREVTASLEGIGVSVIGHLDRQLIDIYLTDINSGRLTEEQAVDLLARWMLPTDVKFHVDDHPWPETSTCLMLGGCDDDGRPLYNELTRLIINTHCNNRLLNPKLNCRYGSESPREYLKLMSEKILAGNNNFALLNDDLLIPACMKSGKTLEHARRYVNGGCQETMIEGEEHSAGAYYYFNMPAVLNCCIQGIETEYFRGMEVEPLLPRRIATPESFEDFYSQFMAELKRMIALGAKWSAQLGNNWQNVAPCPSFSTSIDGCIEKAADYTAGSARYNPSGIALVGMATIVDSLLAIRHAVYEKQICTYDELSKAMKDNWTGMENLRLAMLAAPKFGYGDSDADALAARFTKKLGKFVATLDNERHDHFQASMFVYYSFKNFANFVQATPDGRHAGDLLSQGTAPGRLRYPDSLTQIFQSMSTIDYTDFPGNAVLDLQLPAGKKLSPEVLAYTIRTFAKMKLPTLQPNCVNLDILKDAVINPQKHTDLTVRISGLSAKFVCLERDVQQEIMDRVAMNV